MTDEDLKQSATFIYDDLRLKTFVKPFVKIEIRHFDVSEIEEARLWLSQA
ncbi:MAG: STAS/SEC14 domain-containing protein [Desulfobacterales bacterium]